MIMSKSNLQGSRMKIPKYLLLVTTLWITSSNTFASKDCKVRYQELLPSTYTGECLNGYANGYGTAKHTQKAISYQGNFKGGIPNGQGKFSYVMKDNKGSLILVGNFANGKLLGKAKINFSDGSTYTGGVHLDKKHGYGIFESKDSFIFKGNYRNDKRHGKGVLIFKDGETISGQWVDGKIQGYATQKLTSGALFKGNFKNGKRNGKGLLKFKDGESISGQWVNGNLTGYAVQKYTSGTIFKGNFRNGNRHGKGHIRLASGEAANGIWTKGKLTSGDALKLYTKISKPRKVTRQAQPTGDLRTTSSVIETRIDGDFEGWEGETIFKLMNGQIWQQSDYKYSYHYAFMPEVLIYRSGGSYKMKVDGVRESIRVTRLK